MKPLNDWSHRQARKAAGLTVCVACNDTGYVTRGHGAGGGLIGFYMTREQCMACRCLLCGGEKNGQDGACKCSLEPFPFAAELQRLLGGERETTEPETP